MDKEANNSLNFPYSPKKVKISQNQPCTDVIPADSNQTYHTKWAAFYSMIYRLLSILLSPENFFKELHSIHAIAPNNGYNKSFVYFLFKNMARGFRT